MASIKEQIVALKARFDVLQASLGQQAKSNAELRIKLAQLSKSIDLLVEAEEKTNLLQEGRQGLKPSDSTSVFIELMNNKISIFLEDFQWAQLDRHLPPGVCRKTVVVPGVTLEVRYLSDETEYQTLLETAWKHCPHLVREIEKQKPISSSR
jgi:hypothetical protein